MDLKIIDTYLFQKTDNQILAEINNEEFWVEIDTLNIAIRDGSIEEVIEGLGANKIFVTNPKVDMDAWMGSECFFMKFDVEDASKEKFNRLLVEKILNYYIERNADATEMINIAVKKGHFCNTANEKIYDLTKERKVKKLYSKHICPYKGEDKNFYNAYGAQWGDRNERNDKVYNILCSKDLYEMKEKKYIITDFYCDSGFVYWTKEQFKEFILTYATM